MKVKQINKSRKNLPTVRIEFDTDFEQDKFIDYINSLIFDGIVFRKQIDKNSISGLPNEFEQDFFSFAIGKAGEAFAVWQSISDIHTDENRFQNRNTAFNEISAEQVAQNYNENFLDPVVVWFDKQDNKIYMLSGHSRLEGMKRRKEKFIPIRYFVGSEAEAIKFAKIDANRGANKENLIEDLKAYKLARNGDMTKNINPMSKQELAQAFKGKESRLEMLSYLNPNGKFLEILSDESIISQFPNIQKLSGWVGILKKQFPNITKIMEEDIFNYLYNSEDNFRIDKTSFETLIKERLSYGKERLFPECSEIPCKEIIDFKEVGQNREMYAELRKIGEKLEELKKRFRTNNEVLKIYTKDEKDKIVDVGQKLEQKQKQLQKELNIIEEQPALFGHGLGYAGLKNIPNIIQYNFVVKVKLASQTKQVKYFSEAKNSTDARTEIKDFLFSQNLKPKEFKILSISRV